MQPNPYRAAEAPPPSQEGPALFSLQAIGVHALFLTPIVGVTMAAINYRRLGQRAAFWRTLLFYGLPAAVTLFGALLGKQPMRPEMQALGYAFSLVLTGFVIYDQRDLVVGHLARGGRRARWYLATAAALLFVLALGAFAQVLNPSLRPPPTADAPASP